MNYAVLIQSGDQTSISVIEQPSCTVAFILYQYYWNNFIKSKNSTCFERPSNPLRVPARVLIQIIPLQFWEQFVLVKSSVCLHVECGRLYHFPTFWHVLLSDKTCKRQTFSWSNEMRILISFCFLKSGFNLDFVFFSTMRIRCIDSHLDLTTAMLIHTQLVPEIHFRKFCIFWLVLCFCFYSLYYIF